jgi:hypothetical protein
MKNGKFTPINKESAIEEDIQYEDFLKPLYSLTDLISQELKVMGVSSDMQILEHISDEISYLFEK